MVGLLNWPPQSVFLNFFPHIFHLPFSLYLKSFSWLSCYLLFISTVSFFTSSIQFSSVMSNSLRPRGLQHTRPLSITNSQNLLNHVHWVSDAIQHLILCGPLLLLPSIFPNIRVFCNESVLHIRWPKYWSFSFSISPSNESSGLISFRIDWVALHAVQGTLKSLLQHHSSKESILWRSAFFMVQLSHHTWLMEKT